MNIILLAKRILLFPRLGAENQPTASELYQGDWVRWSNFAEEHDASGHKIGLKRQIFRALQTDFFLSAILIVIHASAAFGAALLLKIFLERILLLALGDWTLILVVAGVIASTFIAWISLNHIFFIADVIGIGARSYVERRILVAVGKNLAYSNGDTYLTALFDREGGRIESAWRGVIVLVLALTTVIFTSCFFFLTLGFSAIAALAIIIIGSGIITKIARIMYVTYKSVSILSGIRIELGTYLIKNRFFVVLNRWGLNFLDRYAKKRKDEENALYFVARLMSLINLVSAITPIASLLVATLLEVWLKGYVEPASVLSAIALIGGLKSVANNVPSSIENLAQGSVAHARVYKVIYQDQRPPTNDELNFPQSDMRHIAIIGASGSGRSTLLRAAALKSREKNVVYVASEPWIFSGTFLENLMVYRPEATNEEISLAMRSSRLSNLLIKDSEGNERLLKGNQWGISRGQAKRLEIARALLSDADEIYIDQPTSGLDKQSSAGLIKELLNGPWREKKVTYITDKPDEIEIADHVWRVENGEIAETIFQAKKSVINQQRSAIQSISSSTTNKEENKKVTLENSIDTYSERQILNSRDTIAKKITRFGILPICLLVTSMFVIREAFVILGDYLLSHGAWSIYPQRTSAQIGLVVLVAALLTMGGSLLTVQNIVRRASALCINYLAHLINPVFLRNICIGGQVGKITWDQRRIDEILPALLLETIGAVTLLAVTLGYVVINSVFLLPLLFSTMYFFSVINKKALPYLASASLNEIKETSNLLQSVSDLCRSSAQLSVGKNKNRAVRWLDKVQQRRAFASIENAATQRWFSYQIDLVGVSIFSFVAVGATASKWLDVCSLGAGLALSLTYSLIAIFGRTARTAVELRQVLDSTDRLIMRPVESSTPPNEAPIETAKNRCLEFNNVTYKVKNSGNCLINNLSISLEFGEVVVITGPSGVGKSTLAALILGEISQTEGKVSLFGDTSPYFLRNPSKQYVQFLTENPVFKPGPIIEHFEASDRSHDYILDRADCLGVREILNSLHGGVNHIVSDSGSIPLSHSELQRLALLSVLITPPKVLILDEAIAGLSHEEELSIMNTLVSELPSTLIIIMTHNMSLIDIADKHIVFSGKEGVVFIDDKINNVAN